MLVDAIDFTNTRRVLVIKLRHHGDVLLTSPVLSVLKQHAPHLEIDALVYADTAPMLADHPALSQLHCLDRQWKKLGPLPQAQAEWRVLQALRARQYDGIIHLTEHKRGSWLARLLRPRWAISPSNLNGKWFRKPFSHRYPVIGGNRRHTVDIHLDALRRLGVPVQHYHRALSLAIPALVHTQAEQKRLAQGINSPYTVIHPTSRWMFKTWPTAQMAQLIQALQQQGRTVLLTAAPDAAEMACIAAIQAELTTPVASLAGQLSLKELGAIIAGADLFIGMDSVPMHMAAATQTPTIALFGPSGDIEWGPWQVPHRVLIAEHYRCRPCGRDGCGGSKISDCLNAISVEQVLTAIEQLTATVRNP